MQLENNEILGQTIDATDTTPKDKLLEKQKSRAHVSGISPKEGGNLTMPGKWKGTVPDTNASWGDWTNYKFPLHDLAHANNAAARLAQNSGYSSEEKAKIKARIEKAQGKHQKATSNMIKPIKPIKLSADEFQLKKTEFLALACMSDTPSNPDADDKEGQPDPDDMPMTKGEVKKMMSGLYDHMYGMMNDIYGAAMKRDDRIVGAVNSTLDDHAYGHLPPMHPGQVKAVLEAAGIGEQFEYAKTPVEAGVGHIYASMSDNKAKLGELKIEIK